MRAYIPGYDLRVPGSLTEALGLLAREPGIWQPFAGGTDLMVLLEAGKRQSSATFLNDEWPAFKQLAWLDKRTCSGSWRGAHW